MASNAKFGAKEVMDVTLYDMATGEPVIYFDTLKTSAISVTSEKVSARGGKGNPKIITWEYNKEAKLNIEDALISPKSLELISGIARKIGKQSIYMRQNTVWDISGETPVNLGSTQPLVADSAGKVTLAYEPNVDVTGIRVYDAETDEKFDMTDATLSGQVLTVPAAAGKKVIVYYTFDSHSDATTYIIDAAHFSGTYKLVGDTVVRNAKTGKDEAFQVQIPNLKWTSNLELGFSAEGEPTATAFECEIMKDTNTGEMIRMIQY